MNKNKSKLKKGGRVSVSGNLPRPGQKQPATIILTQPQRFGIDIATYMNAIRAFENVDYSRRSKLYDLFLEILMDAHLASVIGKRKSAVLCTPIEFRRNGIPDETINEQLKSPWFFNFVSDALDAIFWGFTLVQFYKKEKWMDYDLIPRKHVDPVRRLIMRRQTDINGDAWDEFDDLLFIGKPDSLGLLAQAAPYVIYKRNTLADWAQFSEIFGMPVREYTYDGNDEEARAQILQDIFNEGGAGVYVHPDGSNLKFIESGSKTGSADLYDRLTERCNSEISKLVLGNTLTTEAGNKGTQALGTVHKKIEDRITQSDRKMLLNILNYEMSDIWRRMGIDTGGGEFVFVDPQDVDIEKLIEIALKLDTLGLPLDADDLYEKTGFKKPADYKKRQEEEKKAAEREKEIAKTKEEKEESLVDDMDEPLTPKQRKSFKNWLRNFFFHAPQSGALGW